MRNLKRALSLTLASVMLLGMMVVGSSAAAGYSDVDEKNNVEAIEVLQAIEVMVGDERGFGPDRPVNRAEMAVVMALLLNLDYDYYVSTCPFNDVYDWARGPVGACYANGIVSGRGDGIYDPGATVTAVEAASMLMRALGYFRYQNDYEGNFVLSTVKQGTKIGIFEGVGSSADQPLTRDEVAKMVLNALQTGMVEPDGNTLNLATPDGNIYTGKVNYVNVTSNKDFAKAISRVNASSIGSQNDSPIVELGEQLYNGELKLKSDELDAFGRPSRTWEFKGKAIGTYMKKELLKEEYSVKVTGKDLYDLIGKATIEDKDYDFYLYIDGEEVEESEDILGSAYFTRGDLNKSNKAGVGATGNGVLTQVFVDGDEKEVTIAIINTYLAKATADYNEKKEEATLEVYAIDKKVVGKNNIYVKEMIANKTDSEKMPLAAEDFAITKDIKDGDFFLVNVAEGEIQIVKNPEILSAVTLSAFSKGNYVVTDGTQYDYANAIEYDPEVLDQWTIDKVNLKERNYNVYLDTYGYVAGVDLVEDPDNYVFITGVDSNTSNLAATNFKANAIFLDGTMKTIEVNGKKSSFDSDNWERALVNRWFTYTVNSTTNMYTVNEVNDVIANQGKDYADNVRINGIANNKGTKVTSHNNQKLAQFATENVHTENVNDWSKAFKNSDLSNVTYDIDVKHVSLPAIGVNHDSDSSAGSSAFTRIYGNDDTVYLTAQVETINATNPDAWVGVISDVNNVTVGVKNANITTYDRDQAMKEADKEAKIPANSAKGNNAVDAAYGAYSLYKDNGYIIATVIVGEDNAATNNLVYAYTDDVELERYTTDDDQWTWTRKVAFNGEETEIKEVGDQLTYLNQMEQFNWYQVKYNAKGEVIYVELAEAALDHTTGPNKADGNEYVDYINWVEGAINAKDTVLYEESEFNGETTSSTTRKSVAGHPTYNWNEIFDEKGPSLKGSTFFARTEDKTGFYVDDEVKVIFTQKNNNKRDTTFDEGKDALEDFIGQLNKKGNWFHYEVSAIVKGGQATVVVIRDLYDDGYTPVEVDTSCHTVTANYDNFHTFTITITDQHDPNNVEITEAIRKELVENYDASDVKVLYKQNVVDQVSWTTKNGAVMTLDANAGNLVVNIRKTVKVDGELYTFIHQYSFVSEIGNAAGDWRDEDGDKISSFTAKAGTNFYKITYSDGTTAAYGVSGSTGNFDLWTAANASKKIVSIETGYVMYVNGKFMTAEDAAAAVEASAEPTIFEPDAEGSPIHAADVAPGVTVSASGTKVTLGGEYNSGATGNWDQSPWYYPSDDSSKAANMLIAFALWAPEGAQGARVATGQTIGNSGANAYCVKNSPGIVLGVMVPVLTNADTGVKTGGVNYITVQWYGACSAASAGKVDENTMSVPMGDPVTYTVDGSRVEIVTQTP